MKKLQIISTITILILAIFLVLSCSNNRQTTLFSEEGTLPGPAYATPVLQPTNTPLNESFSITPLPTLIEPGLAYGDPCKPPCWRGLVPEKSTRAEADQVMEQLLTDGWAKHINSSPVGGYSIFPLSPSTRGSIQVTMDKDVVKMIEGDIGFNYSISMVIEQFGSPEGVRSTQDFATCLSCDMWKPSTEFAWTTLIYLLYPKQGLLFWGWVHPTGTGCLCPEMKISKFCYYEPLSMSEALNNNYLADLCLPALEDITEEDLVGWHGFGGGY